MRRVSRSISPRWNYIVLQEFSDIVKAEGRGRMLRKTKIVCTIGPASENLHVLKGLIRNGMNVARLNFSHGTHPEHAERIRMIRQAAEEEKKTVGILLDTKVQRFEQAT